MTISLEPDLLLLFKARISGVDKFHSITQPFQTLLYLILIRAISGFLRRLFMSKYEKKMGSFEIIKDHFPKIINMKCR